MGLLGHRATPHWCSASTTKKFYKVIALMYNSTNSRWEFQLLHIFGNTWDFQSFILARLYLSEVHLEGCPGKKLLWELSSGSALFLNKVSIPCPRTSSLCLLACSLTSSVSSGLVTVPSCWIHLYFQRVNGFEGKVTPWAFQQVER